MYCSHCGKRVKHTMLFCPFCGDPIEIPEQDAPEDAARPSESESQRPAPAPEPERMPGDDAGRTPDAADAAALEPVAGLQTEEDGSAPDGDAEAELLDWNRSRRQYADDVWAERDLHAEDFEPLDLDGPQQESEDWREEISRRKESAAEEKHPPKMGGSGSEPVRLDGVAPKLETGTERAAAAGREKAPRKHANTLVPPKPMNPEDIFMDGGRSDGALDDYDRYDGFAAPEFSSDGYSYEDEGESSFFLRHLRSIVGLAMFVILILMFVIYALSPAGQAMLAKANLAWSANAYSQIGYQSYEAGRYSLAGLNYERALQRDPDNYSYAEAAAMAYLSAKDDEKAAAMLKRCVEIRPATLEPYIYLLNLYPDAAQRPWDVTQLLQEGYRQTGDSRLKVTG